jgi:hypothetical protein
MTALFADTFYWIALADFTDSAHERALAITYARAPSPIVTTDEVLAEFLTFFSTAPEPLRREASATVRGILADPAIRVIQQSRSSFLPGLDLYSQRQPNRFSEYGLKENTPAPSSLRPQNPMGGQRPIPLGHPKRRCQGFGLTQTKEPPAKPQPS